MYAKKIVVFVVYVVFYSRLKNKCQDKKKIICLDQKKSCFFWCWTFLSLYMYIAYGKVIWCKILFKNFIPFTK